jgi:hypothetical protein
MPEVTPSGAELALRLAPAELAVEEAEPEVDVAPSDPGDAEVVEGDPVEVGEAAVEPVDDGADVLVEPVEAELAVPPAAEPTVPPVRPPPRLVLVPVAPTPVRLAPVPLVPVAEAPAPVVVVVLGDVAPVAGIGVELSGVAPAVFPAVPAPRLLEPVPVPLRPRRPLPPAPGSSVLDMSISSPSSGSGGPDGPLAAALRTGTRQARSGCRNDKRPQLPAGAHSPRRRKARL